MISSKVAGDGLDVMISDVVMLGMSGLELGETIRRLYPGLPVVLTSGYSHVLAEQGRHSFEFLHKALCRGKTFAGPQAGHSGTGKPLNAVRSHPGGCDTRCVIGLLRQATRGFLQSPIVENASEKIQPPGTIQPRRLGRSERRRIATVFLAE